MDRTAGPGTTKIGYNAPFVERISNLALSLLLRNERPVYPADDFDFFSGTGDEHHPIGLDALMRASSKLALRRATLIN
jgi:hypothetical protein